MTRRPSSLAASLGADKLALLRPLRPARNLTEEVVARIAEEIRKGRLAPGARLPTEQELMKAMGVSRTVVREAVAALRAEGLVTTRQGSGAFVAADASRVPFRIDPEGLSSIGDVLEVMELRLAVEVEAAALAAERITPERLVPIGRALRDIEAAIRPGRRRHQRGLRLPSGHCRGLGQPEVRPAARVSRPPCHSAPERARVHRHAASAATVPGGHPEGAWPHLRGHSRRSIGGGAQGHAHASDAQPAALSRARRASLARGLIRVHRWLTE